MYKVGDLVITDVGYGIVLEFVGGKWKSYKVSVGKAIYYIDDVDFVMKRGDSGIEHLTYHTYQ